MASRAILAHQDFNKNEIQNAVLQVLAAAPSSPVLGQFFFSSAVNRPLFRGPAAWMDLTDRSLHSGTQLASTISDLASVIQAQRLDQLAAPTSSVAFGGQRITAVAAPTVGTDAANKQYVDDRVAGLSWKDEVAAASVASVPLATVTAGSLLDGETLAAGNRVLLKDQASSPENGIYVVAVSGPPTRASDFDSEAEIRQGTVAVAAGTVNSGTRWQCSTTGPITVGTTPIVFVSGLAGATYAAGSGLSLAGNTFSVNAGAGVALVGGAVAVDASVVARKYMTLVGDGSALAFTVTHNLNNQWPVVTVYDAATNRQVEVDVVGSTANVATVAVNGTPPAANSLRVCVIG